MVECFSMFSVVKTWSVLFGLIDTWKDVEEKTSKLHLNSTHFT